MNIDFHYGIVYAVTRLAGMPKGDAEIVAHACQYVDDSTTPGILDFSGGESFERLASAHEMYDYKNADNSVNRVVWAPFHFLPGGQGETLEDKAVCRPNSEIARAMVKRAIEGRSAENALHRLGVTLHVYVDTWAHQGFSGTVSKHNIVTHLEGDDYDRETWLTKLSGFFADVENTAGALALDLISGLGHGAALHFPDMPWAKWEYTNGHGTKITRDNLPNFIEAADMAFKAVSGFLKGNVAFESETGLPDEARKALETLMSTNRSHDENERLARVAEALASGVIPGIQEDLPIYTPKGFGSWKHAATGISDIGDGTEKPAWSDAFENSHYRKFHDAIKQHRFVVTQEILPKHKVRLA